MAMTVQQMVDKLSKYQPDLIVEIYVLNTTVRSIEYVETSMGDVHVIIEPDEPSDFDD